MSRIYKNSEAWIWGNQIVNNTRMNESRQERYIDSFETDKFIEKIRYNLPDDILQQKYKWNGEQGRLNYFKDTSVRSDFEILNEYNEPYEEGRNTLLWDTCNRYRKNVSSYDVSNNAISRKYESKGVRLLIK
jgi:hypothetical protein